MALPTALLVKGLAGVGAVTGVVGGGFLVKKLFQSKDPNEIIKSLGITNCDLGEEQTKTQECELDETKVKAINFTNKPESSDQTVSGLDTSKKLKLVIEKGYATGDFPERLRFIFKNPQESNDVTIGASGSNQITLKANTSYDFKITSDGTKLEKAWALTTLGAKVGLNCTNDDATECTIKAEGINVWKDQSNYVLEATLTEGSKVKVAKDQKDHKNGFKFTVENNTNLTQANESKKAGTLTQLTKDNMSYEIDLKDLGDNKGKKWFLIEKSTESA